MKRMAHDVRLLLTALALIAAGCGSDGPSAPAAGNNPGGNTPGGTNPGPVGHGTAADCLLNLVGKAPGAAAAPHVSVELPVLGAGPVTERFTAEVAERGGWAYTTTWGRRGTSNIVGDAVKVWDVRGPTPVLVDSIIVPGAITTGDVQISDDGQLLVVPSEYGPANGLSIYDRTDPAHPRFITKFANADTQNGVHTAKLGRVNGKLYAFLSIDPAPAQLVVLDLSDPANPVEVLVRQMGQPFVHDVFVRDGLLFTALWNEGMTIWDVGGCGAGGTPANPVHLVNFQTIGGAVHNISWLHSSDGSRRYVLIGEEQAGQIGVSAAGDIHVVDISDPNAPKEVAFFTVPGAGTHNFSVDEASGVLYAAYYDGGVRALDVRGDLATCASDAKDSNGRCDLSRTGREIGHALLGVPNVYVWGVVFEAGKVYVSDMVHGLYVLDASALTR